MPATTVKSSLQGFTLELLIERGMRDIPSSEQCYLWWKGRLHGEHTPRYEPNPNNYEFL